VAGEKRGREGRRGEGGKEGREEERGRDADVFVVFKT